MAPSSSPLQRYMRLVDYLEIAFGCPFYPDDLLPASKDELQQILRVDVQPDHRYVEALRRFVPFDRALALARDFGQVERKRLGLEYDHEAVKRYWKTTHALYGVDERLDA